MSAPIGPVLTYYQPDDKLKALIDGLDEDAKDLIIQIAEHIGGDSLELYTKYDTSINRLNKIYKIITANNMQDEKKAK